MDLTNVSELKTLLKKHNLWAKKGLSQNFLISREALNTIIQSADLKSSDHIVEVGPGPGVLTVALLKDCKTVTAIEADKAIIPALKESTGNPKHLTIHNQNALNWEPKDQPYKIIANLPYHVTSPILSHFLQAKRKPSLLIVMVQKEVAEKCCSGPGQHSVLSLGIQLFGAPKIIKKVAKSAFYPTPKVDSAILRIEVYEKQNHSQKEIKNFFLLVHTAFNQKRKQLGPTLSKKFGKKIIENLLKKCEISWNTRPQHLSIEEWMKMARGL